MAQVFDLGFATSGVNELKRADAYCSIAKETSDLYKRITTEEVKHPGGTSEAFRRVSREMTKFILAKNNLHEWLSNEDTQLEFVLNEKLRSDAIEAVVLSSTSVLDQLSQQCPEPIQRQALILRADLERMTTKPRNG